MLRTMLYIASISILIASCGGGGSDGGGNTGTAVPPPGPFMTRQEASQFLLRATFGPTDESIDHLVSIGHDAWLDEQFSTRQTEQLPVLLTALENAQLENNMQAARRLRRIDTWWDTVVNGRDQLRQRVAFALSQIFVISDRESALQSTVPGMAKYNDILAEHALGNYRDLLGAVTLNPMMGNFLSMRRNEKANPERNISPDENYAREVMQLFSIGLWDLELNGTRKLDDAEQPIPTFTYYEILEFARVFTGWNYGNAPRLRSNRRTIESETIPMVSFEDFHDRDLKYLLGYELIPAGLDAPKDMNEALDNIFNHDNVAPFISKQLIQQLVTSNPSPDYVERVAILFKDNGNGVRGDLGTVVRAILMDKDALEPSNNFTFGKVKDPLLKVTQLWRGFDAEGEFGVLRLGNPERELGQRPLGAPSVFNFFRPDYQHPGEIQDMDLVSPALQILTETLITSTTNLMRILVFERETRTGENSTAHPILLNFTDEIGMISTPEELIDHLNILLMGGLMSDEMRQVTLDLVSETSDENDQRVKEAVFLIVSSPEFAVQR